jgi:DNA polymerase III subunit delta'
MNSKIIISENLEELIENINLLLQNQELTNLTNPHPDLLYLDQEKLGVTETKQVRQFLSVKPFSAKGRGVVILNAQNLTLDAQNSLLKTLEEPPLESLIILGVNNEHNLLPTILSRCEVIRVKGQELRGKDKKVKYLEQIKGLEEMTIDQKFGLIEKIEEKEQFLKELIHFYRQKLQTDPKYLEFVKQLLEAEKWEKQNVNLRAILEYLMLNMS